MTAVLVAAAVLGVATTASGWAIWQSGRSRAAAALLVLGGVALLLGCAAAVLEVDRAAPPVFRSAAFLLLPLAVVSYPRLSWREPVSFVLLVVVAGAGVLSIVWESAADPMAYVLVVALLLHAWWAYERADARDRRALAWSSLAWGSLGAVVATTGLVAESAGAGSFVGLGTVYLVLLLAGPAAMAVGVVRPDVVDVRGLVTRAVVAGGVFVVFLSVALGLTSVVEALQGAPLAVTPVVVLCGLLAFCVRPLQVLLRGIVDQLLFGDRPDPLAAATSLADRIGDDPALALGAVREALVLPYASIRAGGEVLAASGTEVTHTRVLPLRLGADEVGEVVVGLRAGDLGLSPADEDVLRIVAPLLAQTLRARRMSRDLQRSREAVVGAVEEERRRLRRDLHDGLGPTLSGVAFATDAARNQVRTDPGRAEELLAQLRATTADAITEIRRLVEGLRPPALDELGLEGAIRQHAATLHSASGVPLPVTVDVPAPLPSLSAATEVAAYRIVVEALTNVVRHAAASRASVSLRVDDGHLALAVHDDGPMAAGWVPGVGLSSMRERSAQVGGTLTARATAHGGVVEASIPLGDGGAGRPT
ncbi:sensor histidine kinase [Nocardioides sp. J2M5]|uniref:sensor histidine kinase n=1 Tax=Nocardioides palaemonis TaxID=2829810 RepID=UPI001BABD577|nr:sensor histidine kinase [Nocardioides palaemonis]MBS2936255.1 sensor histidine kinase [Nocardioides palaemonis]